MKEIEDRMMNTENGDRSARSVTNTLPDLHQADGTGQKVATNKSTIIHEQITDISEEQVIREKRKHKQCE